METNTPVPEEKKESPILIEQTPSFYMNTAIFEHGQRVAKMLAASDLVPKIFQNNIGNCVIALNMANRMNADPLMVMQNLYVVHGKPAWSSKFLIATVNASGGFSKLKYEEDEATDGGRTRAYATDKSDGQTCYGAWVSMNMAKAEGWIDKNGSKWKTMPEVMRRYRAASFFVNQFAPEISMGIQTEYEVQDVPYEEIKDEKKSEDKLNQERIELLLSDCKTADEVQKVAIDNPEINIELIKNRIEELGGHK